METIYPKPKNSGDFESLCLALFREHWDTPDLQLLGRSGYEQHGVDFFGQTGNGEWVGGQAKLRNIKERLTETEVRDEVDKAKSFRPPLRTYVIATTANSDPRLQQLAAEITRQHRSKSLFDVSVYCWEQVCELLSAHPCIVDRLYGGLRHDQAQRFETQIQGLYDRLPEQLNTDRAGEFHSEIDAAIQHIKERKAETTIVLLHRLRQRSWDKMSDRERFRLEANLGHANEVLCRHDEAAKHFREAHQYQPEDKRARIFLAIAHDYQGDRATAFELANTVVRDFPDYALARAVQLRCAPDDQAVGNLLSTIPEHVKNDAEIAFALSQCALTAGALKHAEKHARTALASAEDSVVAREHLGIVILAVQLRKHPSSVDAVALGEAVECFTDVIRELENVAEPRHVARLRARRAIALVSLGDNTQAGCDFSVAYEKYPEDPLVCSTYAKYLRSQNRIDEAIKVLDRSSQHYEDGGILLDLCTLLRERGALEDRERAIAHLEQAISGLDEFEPLVRVGLVQLLTNLLGDLGEHERAAVALQNVPEVQLGRAALLALRSNAARRADDDTMARELILEAYTALDAEVPVEVSRAIAFALEQAGAHREALKLWTGLIAHRLDDDVHHVIRCAEACGRHDVVLEYCGRAREQKLIDPRLIEHEVTLYERYSDYEKAVCALDTGIEHTKDPGYARWLRCRRSLLGLRTDATELIEQDPEMLPRVDQVNVSLGPAVVEALRHCSDPIKAAEFAYELLRLHPDAKPAHAAMIASILTFHGETPEIPEPEVVAPGVAVCYRETGTESDQWYIIEDSTNPSQERRELGNAHAIAQAMMGKRKGDEFLLTEEAIQPRTATITALSNKFAYRWNVCLREWQERFPDENFVQMIRVRRTDEENPDFSAIFKSLDQRENHVRRIEEVYSSDPLPLYQFARAAGKTVFESVYHVAFNDNLQVRCCAGTQADVDAARLAMDRTNTVVLDVTAVATLSLVNGIELMRSAPFLCVISEGTLAEIESLPTSSTLRSRRFLAKREEQYGCVERSDEEVQRETEQIRQLVENLRSICMIEPGTALAFLEPEKRKPLEDCLTTIGAEPIALARRPDRVLWTDDYPAGAIARNDYGVIPVWTQFILKWLYGSGHIPEQEFTRISSELLRRRYYFTELTPLIFHQAASMAKWNPDEPPLRQALCWFSLPGIGPEAAWQVAGQSLATAWRRAPGAAEAGAVTRQVIDNLGSRVDGTVVLKALAKHVDKFFGLNVVDAAKTKRMVGEFLALPRQGLVLP